MDDELPEDILSSSLLSLYHYQPITLSSAGAIFVYRSPHCQVTLQTPDTKAANWALHASSVWASSRFLSDHIEYLHLADHIKHSQTNKHLKVLELGAAAGLPSIVIAKTHAADEIQVVVTDYPDEELIRTLAQNVVDNGVSRNCRALAYDWGSPDSSPLFAPDNEKFDVIIAADTLWNPDFHGIFITALKSTLKKAPDSRVYLFAGLHTGRYTIQSFLIAVLKEGFVLDNAFEQETAGDQTRAWSVERADGEDESERRRWIACITLKWDSDT
ncbi:unnamed protein product [Mycena citricolor]|uniref:Nicotinamide N-methyltransferase n=1 Tax=Mycena citricolor TaxID=2018698 RepID=A0AAD2HWA6_9AGAR|nr:unnamed protein product [Mycena citricolor]